MIPPNAEASIDVYNSSSESFSRVDVIELKLLYYTVEKEVWNPGFRTITVCQNKGIGFISRGR